MPRQPKAKVSKGHPTPPAIHEPERVLFSQLKRAPYNPRVITRQEMASLEASLRKHGLVLNLVVQRRSAQHGDMVIVGGHQRLTALENICRKDEVAMPEGCFAIVLDIDDATAMQLNVALNNIEGDFDPFKLGSIFAQLQQHMTVGDVVATGFNSEQIENLVRMAQPPEDLAAQLEGEAAQLGGFGKSVTLTVEFDSVDQRDKAKALLKGLAGDRKAGAVLMEALTAMKGLGRKGRAARAAASAAE